MHLTLSSHRNLNQLAFLTDPSYQGVWLTCNFKSGKNPMFTCDNTKPQQNRNYIESHTVYDNNFDL